ncbi:unnamed protein product [Moneuplotes crassus]|uniref:Uncharacterized protein n=1 Tax=Euplotes crassus TaxID=5936 RepID=A0AAD1XYG6_EUPCR|nr:unnamed protein product [Moneuplotes crassus]
MLAVKIDPNIKTSSKTPVELLRTNIQEPNKEFDSCFFDECDIPDEMDENSQISTPLASRTDNMDEHILIRNKGYLKASDKLEFTARKNCLISVRLIPEMPLIDTYKALKKGFSLCQNMPVKYKKKTRVVRRNPNRSKSSIGRKKSHLSSSRQTMMNKKNNRNRRLGNCKNRRTMSIDQRFTSTAFAPLYNSENYTSSSRRAGQKVTNDFMCAVDVQNESENDEFAIRGVTMKDILPVSN